MNCVKHIDQKLGIFAFVNGSVCLKTLVGLVIPGSRPFNNPEILLVFSVCSVRSCKGEYNCFVSSRQHHRLTN